MLVCLSSPQCLLSWIRQRRNTHPDEEVRCPQCQEVYVLEKREPPLFALMMKCVKFSDSLVPVLASLFAASGVFVAATAYGCLAIRLFTGQAASRRILAGPWPWHVSRSCGGFC